MIKISKECKICKSKTADLRFDVCFDCATAETIIEEGKDMSDKPIPRVNGYSYSMSKVAAILKLYKVKR